MDQQSSDLVIKHSTAIVHKNVKIGNNSRVEAFCLLGVCALENKVEWPTTTIDERAHIRSHTVIYCGNSIGYQFQSGNGAFIREFNKIGNNVSIGAHSIIEHHVHIGDGVRLHSNVFIPEYSVLSKDAWIGPNVVLTNAKYPKCHNAKLHLKGPTIGENAKIGANATILPGVKIGKDALIGAGAVVTENIAPRTVAYGNPAKEVGLIDDLRDVDKHGRQPYT